MLNPKTNHREFSGVPGALGITFGLPILVLLFGFLVDENGAVANSTGIDAFLKSLLLIPDQFSSIFFNQEAWVAYLAWFIGLALLGIVLPGKEMKGIKLRDNTQLSYTINGLQLSSVFAITLLARFLLTENHFMPELQFIFDHQLELTGVAIAFSFLLATFVYILSFVPLQSPNGEGTKERILSINGNTGNWFYDWFIGRELNPRLGPLDIKLFCELRPGLLLWVLINLAAIHHQYHSIGKVSNSIVLITIFQAYYVVDGVLNEEGVLSMIDITTDGFGFMLAFGDLAWLPWTYSIQTRYLAGTYLQLPLWLIILLIVLNLTGYYIFFSSNRQKSDFRQGKITNLKSIETNTGSKLLCDGWWGVSQHINYFGDWLIGWSWCLPTGFDTVLMYFYVVYFGVLLVHRQMRDDQKCSAKYGVHWKEYTTAVPYKIIPYIY